MSESSYAYRFTFVTNSMINMACRCAFGALLHEMVRKYRQPHTLDFNFLCISLCQHWFEDILARHNVKHRIANDKRHLRGPF